MSGRSARDAAAERLLDAWRTPRGWRYLSAVNNSEVGVWYAAAAFAFMLFAGVLALMMRTQLAVPENDLVTADLYNQLYTLHGSIMMFLFAVPIFEALSIILLPEMLGARDMPFPRLSAYGFWCFLIGGLFVSGSLFFGIAPTAGWFMYPPLTTQQEGLGPDVWLLGLGFIEIASIAAAVELITGVLKCRPPGMGINLIPLYAWYVLVVGAMIVFAFPPLIAGDLLFELERAFDWPFFDVERGGDPVLWQHLFWIFGHPEVYIIFLPTIAVLAMVVPTFSQRPVVGYTWIVLSAVGTGFLSFALWVHHMYTTGLPKISQGIASAASIAVALPTGIQIFAFLATMLAGRVIVRLPMLFVFGSIAIFVLGGLTGVMVAIAPFDWQVHDSYFVVAHLHYTLIGGMGFSVLAGVYYFYPFIRGRMLDARLGRWVFWLLFIGFNVTFMPMHLTGMLGMPRRVFTYTGGLGWDALNLISTCGAYVIGAGLALLVFDMLRPKSNRPYAERNPWNAGSLEWLTEMPGEPWGARCIPQVHSRYPLWDEPDLMRRVDAGEFYLADAQERKRETLVTTVVEAEPVQCMRVSGDGFPPMVAAAFTGAAFILATFKLYMLAGICTVFGLAAILWWLWRDTAPVPEKEHKAVGLGLTLPIYASGPRSCGWWGMFITMLADVTAFLSLVFGFYYYVAINEGYDFARLAIGAGWPLAGLLSALAIAASTWAARRRGVLGARGALVLTALAALGCFAVAALVLGPWTAGVAPASHALPAMVWTLVAWSAVHVGLGVVMLLFCAAAAVAGRLDPEHDAHLWNTELFWHFTAFTVSVAVLVVLLVPVVP